MSALLDSTRGFNIVGAVLISDIGPSFGTPILSQNSGDNFFIQSSSDEIFVEAIVELPVLPKTRLFPLRLNRPYCVGDPFLFAFRDWRLHLGVYEKPDLKQKLRAEFSKYDGLPFVMFSIARFIEDNELIYRAMNATEIKKALANDEIERPQFLDPQQASKVQETSTWTDEKVDFLKQYWRDGRSCSAIAAEIGVTRNAVIGKIHRLGLAANSSRAFRVGKERDFDGEVLRPPSGYRKTLDELKAGEFCRWPVGDPGSAEFFFCGAETVSGLPYCSYHSRVAYEPAARQILLKKPPAKRGDP